MDKHIKWIVNQWKREKWFVLLMLVFTLASSAVSIAYPILFGRLLDLLKNILGEPAKYPNPMQEINRIIWVFVALGCSIYHRFLSCHPGLDEYQI